MATVYGPHPAKRAAQPVSGYQYQNHQNGLLQPGQVIHINSYTVTVERYLSQGGFAHVYVVQSQAPVNGTRQHVLKRIAVPNEALLKEVKKEVDVMKVLRGHPNIVNLIDATSNPTGNGTFEVFILMEFCPGGGIIDMMNRRLRERLTEAEILQIFADVCEGVACMHYLKPPLIHRDLKVENILQASLTNFKLCDFGSAIAVLSRGPSSAAELRVLEADINRHTTFQYRAPEMVDVYLRRPVDEKSDVWALGVLLYKLCYYTTPFEEHGQLAIMNVSYRIPPYPVYSNNMNALIASMLREHGVQRPTVFDLLEQVHRLRGTKPLFRYNHPPQQSALPLRPPTTLFNNQPKTYSATAARAAETQKQVFDAIQPMRRGRPSVGTTLTPSPAPLSPIKSGPSKIAGPSIIKFPKPGTLDSVASKSSHTMDMNAWRVGTAFPANRSAISSSVKKPTSEATGFDDSFKESTVRVASAGIPRDQTSPNPPPLPNRTRPSPPARQHHRTGPVVPMAPKRDAFEGLDSAFASKPPPKTLGSLSISTSIDSPAGPGLRSPSAPYMDTKTYGVTGDYLLYPSTANKVSRQPSSSSQADISAEERFPSLEGLDQHFAKAGIGSPHLSGTDTSTKPIFTGLAPPALGSANRTSPLPDGFQGAVRPIGSGSASRTRSVTSRPPSPSGPRSRSSQTSPETRPKGLPPPSYGTQKVGSRFTTTSFSPLSPQRSSEKLSGHGVKPSADESTKASLPKLDMNYGSSTLSPRPGFKRDPSTPVIVAQTRELLEEIFASDVSSPPPLLASGKKHLVPPSTATSLKSTFSNKPRERTPSPHSRGESLRPPERRDSSRSRESSGGDDSPEDAAPRRISRMWDVPRSTSPSRSPTVQPWTPKGVSESRPIGGALTHARKTSAYDLVDVPPPSSLPAVANNRNRWGSSRQGRRPVSVYDLVDIEKTLVSPTIQTIGIQRQRTPQEQTTGNRVSPQDGQFTGNRVSRSAYPSPRPSPVPDPSNAKIQGGPRPRPQSMFLTNSNLLSPSSASSEMAFPNEPSAPPRHRRLSISDIVSKYEEVARGASASSDVPRQGPVSRTPSGASPYTNITTPKLMATGTSLSTSPSKSPLTQPSSQYKSQRSPVSITSPSSSATQMLDMGLSNPHVAKSHNRPSVHPTSQDSEPSASSKSTKEPSPMEEQQQPLTPQRTKIKKLNVVPPPDFMGTQDQPPPSPVRPGRVPPATHSPAPERPYQGVSRLIDQWQKKTEAAMGESNVAGRKPLGSGRAFR